MNSDNVFFNPKGIAVIGASPDKTKVGYAIARNLVSSGFDKEIQFVNPKGGRIFDKEILISSDKLSSKIDLAILAIPAPLVPKALIDISQNGVQHFIIVSGGFREIGAEGALLEKACMQIAQDRNLKILGPNCIGIIDTHLPIDTTFLQPPIPERGNIGLVSHSGALAAAVIDWTREKGMGFSRIASLGNQIDIDESDLITILERHEETQVIAMYLEGITRGREFIRRAMDAVIRKPIVVLKSGKSPAGMTAAASHTGALAGEDLVTEAAFRKAGVIRASSLRELMNWSKALSLSPSPRGNRIAILTNAGGPGVIAADEIDSNYLALADLSPVTTKAIFDMLPVGASARNPIDILATGSPNIYAEILQLLLDDEGVDMVLIIAPAPPMFSAVSVAEKIIPIIKGADKPVSVSFMGDELAADASQMCIEESVLNYEFPSEAISSLGILWKYEVNKGQIIEGRRLEEGFSSDLSSSSREVIEISSYANGFVPVETVQIILERYKIPFSKVENAKSVEHASEIAEKLGYPVVLKGVGEEIVHKSDAGGIVLDINSPNKLSEAYSMIWKTAIEGRSGEICVQKMARPGQEVIVGAVRDEIFGPVVMFGSGGVDVEGFNDVELSISPINTNDLAYLLDHTWAGKKLRGFRNHCAGDISVLQSILTGIGQIMVDFPEIVELEINPLIVYPEGQGAIGVDARIRVRN